jgi:fructose-1,6-bisphosphatase-3
LPKEFEYIIEELLHHRDNLKDQDHYYNQIIQTIIQIGRAKAFIIAISEVIQQLAVDHLHIIGDIYDRGPNPDKIVEKLMAHHSVDIQWGNHDIVWMGAAAGVEICILNIIRICARYGELDILEENYGINILPIAKYAMDHFKEVEQQFYPKSKKDLLDDEIKMIAQINKAVTLMQFKMEEVVINRNKDYHMEDRKLMSKIDVAAKTVTIDGKVYSLSVESLPNVDEKDPAKLTEEELQVIGKLQASFLNNTPLQSHIAFLFEKGSIYKVYNGNLLYHGCIPMDEDGSYTKVTIKGKEYAGQGLLDKYEKILRQAYSKRFELENNHEMDIFWYLWTGKNSSLFGKDTMRTFERTFIEDKSLHVENKNPYYDYIEKESVCKQVLKDFGVCPEQGRIINGHVPVKVSKGESPVKSGGRLIVIDGGLSKAYQSVTGIAGYTLLFNSHGMLLAAHEPFTSAKDAYENNVDMISELNIVEVAPKRLLVGDTDIGKKLERDIEDLKLLLAAYRQGDIKTLLY